MPWLIENINTDLTSEPLNWPKRNSLGTIFVMGDVFGGAQIQIQASPDKILWQTMTDDNGPLIFVTDNIKAYQLSPEMFIRALVTNCGITTAGLYAGVF